MAYAPEGVEPILDYEQEEERVLEAYGLTLGEVGRQVTAASLELPGGSLQTQGGEILVRVSDRKLRKTEFEDIVIRGNELGEIRLGGYRPHRGRLRRH